MGGDVQRGCFLEATRGVRFGVFLPAPLETRFSGHPFFGHPGGDARCGPRKKKYGILEWRVWPCRVAGVALLNPKTAANFKKPSAGVALLTGGRGLAWSWEKGRLVMGKRTSSHGKRDVQSWEKGRLVMGTGTSRPGIKGRLVMGKRTSSHGKEDV